MPRVFRSWRLEPRPGAVCYTCMNRCILLTEQENESSGQRNRRSGYEVHYINASSPKDDSFSAVYRCNTRVTSPFFSSCHENISSDVQFQLYRTHWIFSTNLCCQNFEFSTSYNVKAIPFATLWKNSSYQWSPVSSNNTGSETEPARQQHPLAGPRLFA